MFITFPSSVRWLEVTSQASRIPNGETHRSKTLMLIHAARIPPESREFPPIAVVQTSPLDLEAKNWLSRSFSFRHGMLSDSWLFWSKVSTSPASSSRKSTWLKYLSMSMMQMSSRKSRQDNEPEDAKWQRMWRVLSISRNNHERVTSCIYLHLALS